MEASPFSPQASRRFLAAAMISFVVCFGATWIWVICAPMAYLSWDYPVWLAKQRMIENGLTGKVVIVGDSTPGADLLPNRLGANVVNLALSGATPVEVYYQSKEVLARSSVPSAVILSLSPHRFMMQDTFWGKSALFGALTFEDVEEVRAVTREFGETGPFGAWSPADLDVRLTAALYAIKFPPLYVGALLHARLAGRGSDNLVVYRATETNRGQMYYGRDPGGALLLDQGTAYASFAPSKVLDEYFRRTLELYRHAHIPVYFLAMPHNEISMSHYPAGLREKFTAYLDQYAGSDPNFHVLGDPLPSYPSLDFGDSAHLNEKGATLWSDAVAQMLNAARVPGGPFGPN